MIKFLKSLFSRKTKLSDVGSEFKELEKQLDNYSDVNTTKPCGECNGCGILNFDWCKTCNGTGK